MVIERSVFTLGDGEDVRTHAAGAVPAAVHDVAFQIAHKSNFSALPCVLHPLGKYSFIPSAEPSYRRKIATSPKRLSPLNRRAPDKMPAAISAVINRPNALFPRRIVSASETSGTPSASK